MNSCLVTIIIPTYKNLAYLRDCIISILEQDYPRIELIVVDDGTETFSPQEWAEFVLTKKTINIENVIVYSNVTNLGTVKSLNGALSRANGDIIKIIACDDALFDKNTISTAVALINNSQFGDCFAGDVCLCDSELKSQSTADNSFLINAKGYRNPKLLSLLCCKNYINAAGVFFKKTFFQKNGFFDENYRLLEDWPTWLKIYIRGEKIIYLNTKVAKRRVSTGVVSNNNPFYLKDKRNTWKNIVRHEKKTIGMLTRMKSFLAIYLSTVPFLRKIAYLFCKKR